MKLQNTCFDLLMVEALKGQFHGSAHVHIIYSPVHALLQGPLFHCL